MDVLYLVAAPSNNMVERTGSERFEWTLTPESWLQTDELLEPFCDEQSDAAFQYLNPAPGPEVIYSTDRAW